MKISELIKKLETAKDRHGDLECVVETVNFFNKSILSTVESLEVKNFEKGKAILIDWRC